MIEKCKKRFLQLKFEACGVSFSEGIVILVIDYNTDSNQDNISVLSGVDKFRITRIMTALEERGIIFRKVNPANKREKLVELTALGKNLAHQLGGIVELWNEICLIDFTDEEKKNLEQILDKITKNVREYLTSGACRSTPEPRE